MGQRVEEFFAAPEYKEYLENAVSFNRKLNEERKMRLPYIDGQTGVAQRHYNSMRTSRERMPPSDTQPGKLYCYPQKHWHKKRYQYLKYYMAPKQRFDPEADMHTISQVENPSALNGNSSMVMNEDSNHSLGAGSGGKDDSQSKEGWSYYEDDIYQDGSMLDDDFDSGGSDYDYEDTTYGSKPRKKGEGRSNRGKKGKGMKGGPGSAKRRTHADAIPDSEKPFSCERLGAARASSRRSTSTVNYKESDAIPFRDEDAPLAPTSTPKKPVDAKGRAVSLGYCDFCLGDSSSNKKTGKPEELVVCAECGRSGHPTCLQFTENMIVSVRQYPWQCIECKCCTLCGTSENDDQLLFCDDCDRGYHMYCLKPPIKEPPEGSWSCNLCIERFHKK